MPLTAILGNPLDLSVAEVVRHSDAQFLVTSILTPVRMILAAILGAVALYFLWQMKRDFAEASWFSLFPGILIAPVFGVISIVFFFAHHEKEFLVKERRAIVRGSMFGLSAQRDYPIPLTGRVLISLRKTLNRTEGHVSQFQSHYDVSIDGMPAMGFTVAGDRQSAQDFAKKLAEFLAYELIDQSKDPAL